MPPIASTSTAPPPSMAEPWRPSAEFGSEMASHEYGFLSDMLDQIGGTDGVSEL